jgi:starch-binding outer membrane protein, SusD/RagB family
MMRLLNRGRWVITASALAAGPLFVAACNVKQELLQPQNPSIIGPDQVNSPTAADALRKGVYARLRSTTASINGSFGANWAEIGVLGDEWKSANTFSQHQEVDSRSMALNNSDVSGVYGSFQSARGAAYTAIGALKTYLPTPAYIAQMYFTLGFAELSLGQNFCNGIPLGVTVDGVASYSKPYTDAEVFAIAITHFDSALTLVASLSDTASVNVANAVRIAKARALVELARFVDAAALVGSVQTNYLWMHTYATTSGDNGLWNYNNSVKRLTVGDSFDTGGIILNALPFASAKDPRVPVAGSTIKSSLGVGFDNTTNLVTQQLWPSRSDPIPFLTGVDARLIEAEAKLQAKDIAGMMTILNALRASPHVLGAISSPVMAALPAPATQDAAINLYFREKAFWQFSRGTRVPDLRRLIRQYGRSQDKVFPSGQFFKGQTYQTDVNFPVTTGENANPNFKSCIDRNA